jgi:hypothetical protein
MEAMAVAAAGAHDSTERDQKDEQRRQPPPGATAPSKGAGSETPMPSVSAVLVSPGSIDDSSMATAPLMAIAPEEAQAVSTACLCIRKARTSIRVAMGGLCCILAGKGGGQRWR